MGYNTCIKSEEQVTATIMEQSDIDQSDLDRLNIFELRNLAHEYGVAEPMTKTHEEIISELRRKIAQEHEEQQESYQQVILE